MDNRKENIKLYKHINKENLETDFSENNSIDNFSYSSDNFIYSPLKCHYPSSYIPSDGYKNSKCIRIKKHTSHDKKRNRKSSNNYEDIKSKNDYQDSSSELSVKKRMEFLQNDRNKRMETILKKTENNSQNGKSNLENESFVNDDSFFSINSIPTISSFSFGSSDQTKSTIKRIYKNYMDSISIDSPSKLSNETFLKYIETPIFEKTKVMFGKEEKEDKSHSKGIFDASPLSDDDNNINKKDDNNNNRYKLYYNSLENDNESNNSYLSNSPIIQYQKHISSKTSFNKDDNILLTPKSKGSPSFPNNNNYSSSISNSSLSNIKPKIEKSSKDISISNKLENNDKKNLLKIYSLPNHNTIPSFIDNVTSKFDSEINYIKENPLLVSSTSYSSKNISKFSSNKNSAFSTANDTLDNISITNEDIEVESFSNPNSSLMDNEKINNDSAFYSSVVSQNNIKTYKNNISYDSKIDSDSLKIRYSFTDDIQNSVKKIYDTPKYNDKSSIKSKNSLRESESNSEKDNVGSYEIISPTESFEEFLKDSKKLVKNRNTGIGRKIYEGQNKYKTFSSNKKSNDVLVNKGEFSDDNFDNDSYSNKNQYRNGKKISEKKTFEENNVLDKYISLNSDSSFFSTNSDKKENNDISISIRKNNSYDNNKYSTNTKNQENNNNVPKKIYQEDDNSIKYKSSISQLCQDDEKTNDGFNDLLGKFKKENRSIRNDSKLKSSISFNKSQINDNKSLNNFSTLINDNEEDDILSDANQKEFKKFNEVMNNLSSVRHSDLYFVQTYTTSTDKKLSNSGKISALSSTYKKEKKCSPSYSPVLNKRKSKSNNSFSEIDYRSCESFSDDLLGRNACQTYPNNTNSNGSNGNTIVFEDNENDHHSFSFDSSDMIIESDDNDEIELPFDKITLSNNKEEGIRKKEKKDTLNDDDNHHSTLYNLRNNRVLDNLSFDNNETIDSFKPFSSKRKQSTPVSKSDLLSPINHSINLSLSNNDSFFNYSIIEPSVLKNKDNDRNGSENEQSEYNINNSICSENCSSNSKNNQTSSRRLKLPENDRCYQLKEVAKSSSILSSPTLLNYYHQELEKENEEKNRKKHEESSNLDIYEKLMNENEKNNMKLICDIITRMNTIQTDLNRKFEMQSKILEDLMTTKEDDDANHDVNFNHNIPPLFSNDDTSSYHVYDSTRRHPLSANNYSSTLNNSTNSLSLSHYHQFKTLKSYQKDIEKLNKYQNSNMEYLLEVISDIKGK
ncbi:hypothetical protein PIROE2DRAFT_5845 [Piromyces sp. E2]|nr:hypothetical protein PIROE2DRAFT_5845 [Piromyces sp. E2]|eukprot:OUM66864.1 hypothetical protein PIROE2DRAFT_5845 [Piromyces sp. E2]